MLNACHFATLTNWGGVERMLLDLFLYSKQDRVRHTLFTTSSKPELVALAQQAGVYWFQPEGRFRYDPRKFLQLAQQMSSQQIQVVHSYDAYANSWAGITSLIAKTPVFLTGEHGTVWNVQPPIDWLNGWAHRRARLVVANSQASARFVELRYRVPASCIRVVYNAVSPIPLVSAQEIRAQLGIDQDVLIVGSVGRLNTAKGYATFIETAAQVLRARQDVVFILVGGGPLENELRAYVTELGLQDRFRMTGWRADARRWIQGFDIFVSTSVHESFGNAMVEAALCAIPVIAPSIDGVPEVVVHEQTGILLCPTQPIKFQRIPKKAGKLPQYVLMEGHLTSPRSLNPEILATTILNLLADYELRVHYGKQARKRAKCLYSIERYAEELENIYLEVATAIGRA